MAERVQRMWCRQCDDWRKAKSVGANHLLHLVLVIVLAVISAGIFGLLGWIWLFVWVLASIREWNCEECGSGSLMTAARFRSWERRQERRAAKPVKPPKESAAFKVGKALRKQSTDERIPPKPSVLHETAYAEWMAKYGNK